MFFDDEEQAVGQLNFVDRSLHSAEASSIMQVVADNNSPTANAENLLSLFGA